MAVLIAGLLAILSVGVILYPFWKAWSRTGPSPAQGSPVEPGQGEGSDVFEEIRTLQLEYELGAVDEADYRDRLRADRLRAAAGLRDREQLDRALEEEILAQRADGRQLPPASPGEGRTDDGPDA